jgi:putative transposase
MLKTFKYRIYPTKRQETLLNQTIGECRWLYNHLLELKSKTWKENSKNLSFYDLCNYIVRIKLERNSLMLVHSQVLQDVAMRIDFAFKALFRRVKAGQKPGYPRFKGKDRYDSFAFPQSGCSIKNEKLKVSKVGDIKLILTKELKGKTKIINIKRTSTNKWYVSFIQEVGLEYQTNTNKSVGIDVGLKTFATLSDGVEIPNPRFFKQEEDNLAKAQRKLSKAKKGSKNKIKRCKVVARIYERVTNKRSDFSHQISRQIINSYDIICIEDLNINRMQENNFKCVNRSISDVAWKQFFERLSYKAAEAGKKVIKVNPAYTSQDCHRCGNRQKLSLSQREYICPCCGLSMDRDLNASLNILRLGTQSLKPVRSRIRKAPTV